MSEIKFGQSTPRREDERLVRGQGVFTADLRPDGLCHAFFVRSPHVRARILGIDALQAASMPGVIGVFTAADLEADKIPSIASQVDFKRPDGSPAPSTRSAPAIRAAGGSPCSGSALTVPSNAAKSAAERMPHCSSMALETMIS